MSPPIPKFDKIFLHFTRHEDRSRFGVDFFHVIMWGDALPNFKPELSADTISKRLSSAVRCQKLTITMREDALGNPIDEVDIPCRIFLRVQAGMKL